jgi:hypothetical protein
MFPEIQRVLIYPDETPADVAKKLRAAFQI